MATLKEFVIGLFQASIEMLSLAFFQVTGAESVIKAVGTYLSMVNDKH